MKEKEFNLYEEKQKAFDLFIQRLRASNIKLDVVFLSWIEDLKGRLKLVDKEFIRRLKLFNYYILKDEFDFLKEETKVFEISEKDLNELAGEKLI